MRRAVGQKAVEECATNSLARTLDRRGKGVMGAGDVLLGLGARHLNLGWGVFVSLKVTHLIPQFKLTTDHFLRLAEEMTKSNRMLQYIVDPEAYRRPHPVKSFLRQTYRNVRLALAGDMFGRAMSSASARGARQAERIIEQLRA